MATLIKNQIVKHLSKFTKNLSSDKIQLSTLKGEGELTNLELNEDVLMELMDLPTWLRLTKAVCNRVQIKIQWSKLKSQPIRVYLDEVQVLMEMCDVLRVPSNTSGLPSYSSGGAYGFGDRVVDGMFLQINTVVINFTSQAFKANLNLSKIVIQSTTPTWRVANDIKYTRISEKHRDLLLTFKQIEWQTLRIEADCMVANKDQQTTPLRLITNQCKIRISVKKRYSDCSAVATRVQFILDDLLWILTDSQMKAAVVLARSMKDKIDESNERSKVNIAQTLQKQQQANKPRPVRAQSNTSPASALFNKFDIPESSYHIQSGRIDLHICDDINVEGRRRGVDGGAIGLAFTKLAVSHYPTRPAGGSRKSWPKYDDDMMSRDQWATELLQNYESQIKKLKLSNGNKLDVDMATHQLIERLTVLTIEDFFITTVSNNEDKGLRAGKLLFSDKKALYLPTEMSSIHIEHTEYFFPSTTAAIPPPCPNMYMKINPIKFTLDTFTIEWLNSFALSLAKDVEQLIAALPVQRSTKKERVEYRLEALMPKIILLLPTPQPDFQHDRPNSLEINISRLIVTNNQKAMCSQNISSEAHKKLLAHYKKIGLHNDVFPNAESDLHLISRDHEDYVNSDILSHLNYEEPNLDNDREIISIELEQFWMEFTGVRNLGARPASFVESFPISVWVAVPGQGYDFSKGNQAVNHSMSVMVNIGAKIFAQINHYQFCFLMRLMDSISLMTKTIANEAKIHEDELTEKMLAPISHSTVVLEIKEVEFAMLAAPSHDMLRVNEDTDSTDQRETDYDDELPNTDPVINDSNELTQEHFESSPVGSKEDYTKEIAHESRSDKDLDTDSGFQTSSSVASSLDFKTGQSVFYHNPNNPSVKSQSASTFYTNEASSQQSGAVKSSASENKLASAFSKMTTKMKIAINKTTDDFDNSDSLSVISGISDDDDYLEIIASQEEELAFESHNRGELNKDESASVVNTNLLDRPKQMFSVTKFKISGIEVGVQLVMSDVVAKITVESIANEECGNVYYDDFHSKLLSDLNRCLYTESTNNGESKSVKPISVRFTMGPSAASKAYRADEKGFAHIKVSDYGLEFLSSTVEKLGPLFKDESASEAVPLLIEINNFDLTLRDNKQPVYNTIWPDIPIKLHIEQLAVHRMVDGTISLCGGESSPQYAKETARVCKSDKATNTVGSQYGVVTQDSEQPKLVEASSSAQVLAEMKYLQTENSTLKEQIIRLNERLLEKDHDEFHRTESGGRSLLKELELCNLEIRRLKGQLKDSHENIEALESTKECLLQTIVLLRGDLSKYE